MLVSLEEVLKSGTRPLTRGLLLSTPVHEFLLLDFSILFKADKCAFCVLLQKIDSHFIVLRVRQELDMVVKACKSVRLNKLADILKNIKTCSYDVLMLLSATLPDLIDQGLWEWALLVLCSQVYKL